MSNHLLNIEVLEDLKQAIRQAKDASRMTDWLLSIDVESDGPCPSLHSMLSLGAVLFDDEGKERDTFSCNFELLHGAVQDPITMAWWEKHPEAYAETRKPPLENPNEAMSSLYYWALGWIQQVGKGRITPIAYRAAYDAMFFYYYLLNFGERRDPFSKIGSRMLDIQSYAAALLSIPFSQATRRNFPTEWAFGCTPHDHCAVSDARNQGIIFINMLKWRKNGRETS